MQKLSRITKISIAVFLFISILALSLSIPVFLRLEKIVDKYTKRFTDDLAQKTGLVFSYESISPSVFAYLGIKGITVSEQNSGQLGEIKRINIKYKLMPLLKGEYDSIIKGISIDGVVFNLDAITDYIQKNTGQTQNQKVDKPPSAQELYSQISSYMDYVPPYVTVKNLSVKYTKDLINASLLVKEIRVLNSEHKDSISFNIKTNVAGSYKENSLNGDVLLDGTITKNLDDSFAHINLANFVSGKYKFNKFNFLLTYKDKQFDVRTIQNVMPVMLSASYNLSDNQLNAELDTDNLNIYSVISNAAKDKNLEALKNLNITAKAGMGFNINTNLITYYSSGNVHIPQAFFPGEADISYSVSGDDKKITVKKLSAKGQDIDANVELSYIFKTMQASGTVDLAQYVLPNGKTASTEIYFDPLKNSGFMIFSPQVIVGDHYLTALQARVMPQDDSIDFDFEINDYSHIDQDNQGIIKADGSYMLSSNYIQTSISLASIYLDTIFNLVAEVLPQKDAEAVQNIIPSVEDYMFTGDAYISTDFKSLSYNLPYLVLANTKKDNQFVLLSLNGNEQSIQLNRFNLIFGSFALDATASLDSMPDSSDKFYTVDIISSSIPYHFSGTIMPEIITMTGDYSTDARLLLGNDKSLQGFASFKYLPLALGTNTFLVSLDSSFDFTQEQGPQITLTHFELEQDIPDVSVNPRLELSGSGTKYGAQINNISYTDLYSSLTGNSDITINLLENNLSSAGIQMNLHDSITEESIIIDASVSNPDNVELSGDNLFKSLYVNAMIQASNFSLNRFMALKHDNNELTASLSLSGTLEHPYATASVEKLSFLMNDEIVFGSGSIILEERDVTLNDFNIAGAAWGVTEVSGNASLSDFTGSLKAKLYTKGDKNIEMPLIFTIENSYIPQGSAMPESLSAKLSSPGLGGTLFKAPIPFELYINYSPDFISFFSSENAGFYGNYSTADGLYASWNPGDILSMEITGSMDKANSFVKLSNINVNLDKLLQYFTMDDVIKVNQGILKGSITMRDPQDTPDFKGALSIANPVFMLPSLFEQKISTEKILITAANNEFNIAESNYNIKNTPKFKMSSHVYMNKWTMDHFDMKIATLENQSVPVRLKSPLFSLSADTECNFTMTLENNNLDFTGSLFAENLDITSDITELTKTEDNSSSDVEFTLSTDLKITTGTHATLNFNPLLRCVFVPHMALDCKVDTAANLYQLDGSLNLKSGDVAYLNRNFYIKEGSIKFNPLDIANPQVTIRAETREKDSEGQTIRIILSAENQYLLDFNPHFSSVPSKSENEIRLLLGQIVLADSESVGQLVLSAGEYYLQSTIVRNLENKLRDLLNFDIFSVRTNIIQNTINLSSRRNQTKELTIGNFFDNSTVYIGKYIGSALYVDAMLNMSASDYRTADYLSANSILFQPEFGLELELPVINIRWDMAWNIMPGLSWQSYVPSTSVSLSWKFNF